MNKRLTKKSGGKGRGKYLFKSLEDVYKRFPSDTRTGRKYAIAWNMLSLDPNLPFKTVEAAFKEADMGADSHVIANVKDSLKAMLAKTQLELEATDPRGTRITEDAPKSGSDFMANTSNITIIATMLREAVADDATITSVVMSTDGTAVNLDVAVTKVISYSVE